MKRKHSITALGFLLIGCLALPVAAQQGWSATQPITQNGSRATVNAVYYDGDDVWVVGAQGLVVRSYDDGRTFQPVQVSVNVGLNDVCAMKDRVWIVGDGGVIITSKDGGTHFKETHFSVRSSPRSNQKDQSAPLDLYSLQFVDESHGFIVGDQGLILATTDSGASWREQKSGIDAQLFHLAVKGERAWVVGTGGTILHTDNGGQTWYPQFSGVHSDLNRVYVVSDKVVLVTGDGGVLLRSENWGTTWARVAIDANDPLFGVSFIDKKTGWIVGSKGRIIRTFDGGRSWVEQESGTRIDLFSVSFHKNRGYAIGRDGLVLRYFERR